MVLTEAEQRIVFALGQTMFPRDGVLGLDGDDVHVVAWVDDYLRRMPALSRTQIRALLRTFELGYGVWAGRPRETFSQARPDARAAYLESWEHSATYAQRMLYEALRSFMAFAYVESDEVRAVLVPEGTWGDAAYAAATRTRATTNNSVAAETTPVGAEEV